VLVSGITLDSRLVEPGDLYVALPGRQHHGAEFLDEAAAAGAVAVLTDAAGGEILIDSTLPVLVLADPRHAMAAAAAAIYGEPAAGLLMFAVTGTNGKTTTTFLLEAALQAAGVDTGLIGTVGFRLGGRPLEGARTTVTTPEATEVQGLLGRMREEGAAAVLMEVSSHALVLGRADAILFDVAAFTNLGRDHLDFHGTEEAYFKAKASLFTADRTRHAVVNIDDARGRELADDIRRQGRVGLTTVSLNGAADCRAVRHRVTADGRTTVRAVLRGRELEFGLNLPGAFNVRNALTALAMVHAAHLDVDRAAGGLGAASVPGRMERVDLGSDGPVVYVDFAHTPQAVTAALEAVGEGRRVVVLGCGGDRDARKRGPMGEAAARAADVVVVTDDNPRSEDPAMIRAQVLAGARRVVAEERPGVEVRDGGDRRSAIREGLRRAGPGAVVAILGKGHELGQETAGQVLPFSDAQVVVEEWAELRAGPPQAVS
jgi:UDP-N-acetylmuramoyl-L-alanyl-D-glutamate--2,6-diaminopimelate ligase